jgi:hypothetical protein
MVSDSYSLHRLEDKLDKPSDFKEKRKRPRVLVNLTINLRMIGEPNRSPGMVSNASETGLLINTLKDIPPGEKVIVEVLFSENGKSSKFKALAEIAWKDIGLWDDWEGFLYGLKFIRILDGDPLKLKPILGNQFSWGEASFGDEPNPR